MAAVKSIRPVAGLFCALLCMAMAGCAPHPKPKPESLNCERLTSVEEAVSLFDQQRENRISLRSGGDCRIMWYDEKGGKHEEKPSVKLFFCPPEKVFLIGTGLIGEMLRLATNEQEFYLRIKPKEVSAYWFGRRNTLRDCSETMLINPESLLESLGLVRVDPTWILTRDHDMDVLTKLHPDGKIAREIWIDCFSRQVRRMTYHSRTGQKLATVELTDYKTVGTAVDVPQHIEMTIHNTEQKQARVELKLSGVQPFEPNQKQREGLFERADSSGFEHVYELTTDCRFIEQ
ncbi:MAG: hypothetical protein JW828_09400 [Sedimentisphaerales bacterium]|nr:hypothetical protein [Sedimentisphaerales bacterium]